MEEMHPAFQAAERGFGDGSSCENTAPESCSQMGKRAHGLFRRKKQTPVF